MLTKNGRDKEQPDQQRESKKTNAPESMIIEDEWDLTKTMPQGSKDTEVGSKT